MFERTIQFFLPDLDGSSTAGAVHARRARLTVLISLIMIACVPLYSLSYADMGYYSAIGALFLAAGVMVVNLLLLRQGAPQRLSGNVLAGTIFLVLAYLVLGTGGTSSSSNPWLTVVPLVALLVASRRAALSWMGVAILFYVGVFTVETGGHVFTTHVPAATEAQTTLTGWVGLVVVITLIALAFQNGLTAALDGMEEARAQAESDAAATRAMADEQRELRASVEQKVEEAVQASEAQQRYLEEQVGILLEAMQRFEHGDLTIQLEAQQQDTIGELFRGFNRATRNLRARFEQVQTVVEETAAASRQIRDASHQLSASAQEQSAQADEVAAAVEEMTRTIIENSESAHTSFSASKEGGELARQGGAVVEQTVAKIRDIADVVGSSAATVEQLGVSSKQIGEIVETIEEIADQTNLLALNAAIEAARAGEQGKGFAVVADEVRKLAERTSNATGEIAQMIRQIQQETSEAVDAMRTGTRQVDEGLHLADRTGEALEQIVAATDRIGDQVAHVASASEQQSATSEQISRSIQGISSVSEDAAAGVTQVAEAATELDDLTGRLTDVVGQFRLRRSAAESQPPVAVVASGDGSSGSLAYSASPHV